LNFRAFFVVFITIFLAEIGDKTNIAALLFSTRKEINKMTILGAATLAFVAATLVSIIVGTFIGNVIPRKVINYVSGIIFILIGIVIILSAIK